MSAHFAWLILPHWLHWLAYLPAGVMAVVLCLVWPAELLAGRFPGPSYLAEWPDDYDQLELAQLADPDYCAAAQAAGIELLNSLGSAQPARER